MTNTVTKQATATKPVAAARQRPALVSVDLLADAILAKKAAMAIAEAELKVLTNELLTHCPVGTEIVRPDGKLTVTERTDLVADVEELREVCSRAMFKDVTKTVFDVQGYRALVQLGKSTDEVDAVVTEKVSAPFVVTRVAKK